MTPYHNHRGEAARLVLWLGAMAMMLAILFGVAFGQNTMPIATAQLPSTDSVTLAWDASPSPEVTGYRIYYGTETGRYTNSATVGNVTSASIVNLKWGATFYFVATAYDDTGLESDFSNEVAYTLPPPPQPALGITVDRLKIEWMALANVNYTLQWSTNLTSWTTHATLLSGTNFTARYLVTNDTPRKYWRVKL